MGMPREKLPKRRRLGGRARRWRPQSGRRQQGAGLHGRIVGGSRGQLEHEEALRGPDGLCLILPWLPETWMLPSASSCHVTAFNE